jgi:hypothetical protein
MQNPNPVIPLSATLSGCHVIFRGLRRLPIDEAADLLNELVEQVNAFIKAAEDKEKAAGDASAKAVDTVAQVLKRRGRAPGSKNKPKAPAAPAPSADPEVL